MRLSQFLDKTRQSLLGALLLTITLTRLTLAATCDPWPPFWFGLTPAYQDGQIIYLASLYSRVEWDMVDLEVKIPLPAGTRFLRAEASPDIGVQFDGVEITLRKLSVGKGGYYDNVRLFLEPTSADQTNYVTRPWITWKGEHAGSYLHPPISFDITQLPPPWTPPPRSHLRLNLGAWVGPEQIIYTLYAQNSHWNSLVDVWTNLPLPPGTELQEIAADAPYQPFNVGAITANREASFRAEAIPPATTSLLTLTLRSTAQTQFPATTKLWTRWGNPDTTYDLPQQSLLLDPLSIRDARPRYIIFDAAEDVPAPLPDLLAADIAKTSQGFQLGLETREPIPQNNPQIYFTFHFNTEPNFQEDPCAPDATPAGIAGNPYGPEYEIRYYPERNGSRFYRWLDEAGDWDWSAAGDLYLNVKATSTRALLSMPKELLPLEPPFQWWVTSHYLPSWPVDAVPNDAGNQPLQTITAFVFEGAGQFPPSAPQQTPQPVLPQQPEHPKTISLSFTLSAPPPVFLPDTGQNPAVLSFPLIGAMVLVALLLAGYRAARRSH
jgi:hypothetical protein